MHAQRTFDQLGTPLHEVTFVVVDVETTGASPDGGDEITEIGAVKLRGGEELGRFHTLVNPGVAIPPSITYLTGITQAMVMPAPRIEAVMPSFLEWLGDAVIVGHNVRFDLSFIGAAVRRSGGERLPNRVVDTLALARRLVRDEVPNLQLSTLARHVRTAVQPSHRALDDALATGDVLHALLERAGTLGVLGLDDLLELPTVGGHPQAQKLKLTAGLPRKPGVYLFRDRGGRVLYVGKAVDLRRRVRSYFSGDERRKVGQLLREVESIDHIVCSGELEASVLEVRLIHELTPRFNRQAKLWKRYAYVKLTLDERWPRLSVVRTVRPADGCLYLGPLPSSKAAQLVVDAIHTTTPLRRCNRKPSRSGAPVCGPCVPGQLGVAACPCSGATEEAEYRRVAEEVARTLAEQPERLLDDLRRRMTSLAEAGRYEEAAAMRDRAAALSRAVGRQRRLEALRRAGRVRFDVPGEGEVWLDHGRLAAAGVRPAQGPVLPLGWGGLSGGVAADLTPAASRAGDGAVTCGGGPVPRELADEIACIASWLEAHASRVRILECDGWSLPARSLPRFEPTRR